MATYTLIRQLFSRYLEMNNRIGKMYQKIDKHLNSTFMATFLICLIMGTILGTYCSLPRTKELHGAKASPIDLDI